MGLSPLAAPLLAAVQRFSNLDLQVLSTAGVVCAGGGPHAIVVLAGRLGRGELF